MDRGSRIFYSFQWCCKEAIVLACFAHIVIVLERFDVIRRLPHSVIIFVSDNRLYNCQPMYWRTWIVCRMVHDPCNRPTHGVLPQALWHLQHLQRRGLWPVQLSVVLTLCVQRRILRCMNLPQLATKGMHSTSMPNTCTLWCSSTMVPYEWKDVLHHALYSILRIEWGPVVHSSYQAFLFVLYNSWRRILTSSFSSSISMTCATFQTS